MALHEFTAAPPDLGTIYGFAVFNVDQLNDTIKVNVSAKNLLPNTKYDVNLWVASDCAGGDCIKDTVEMTTSRKGNGGAAFV